MSTKKSTNYESTIELRAVCEVQQDFAKASVLHSEQVWDVIGPDQSNLLFNKLDCMFPLDKQLYTTKELSRKVKKQNATIVRLKESLHSNIWKQRKYTNGVLLHSIIYVMVTSDIDIEKAKFTHNYTMHPVFRTRRCLKNNSSAGCCMVFIDEKSRVYQNWSDFVNNNQLPYGIMIAPKNGCYSLDENNQVFLECSFTPDYSKQALSVVDKVVSVSSLLSQTLTHVNPVFSILTIGAKTYETIRNYQKISDKVAKGTSTSCKANINLACDIICLTSSVATFGAHVALPADKKLSIGTELTLQTVNGVAALIHCTKLIKTSYDLFTKYFVDGEELGFSDLLAFSSSLILFTNSINNISLTSQIGNIDGNFLRGLLQSKIRSGLSFLSAKVIKLNDQNGGNVDILRLINDIPYKDVFCNMLAAYNNITSSGFLATLSFLGAAAIEIAPGISVKVLDKEITELNLEELLKHYGSKFVEHIANCHNLIDILNCIGLYFPAPIVQFLFNQTRNFIEKKLDDSPQNSFITSEMILYKMFSYIIKNYKDFSFELLKEKQEDIFLRVTNFFKSLNPNVTHKDSQKYNCNICGGYYYLVEV